MVIIYESVNIRVCSLEPVPGFSLTPENPGEYIRVSTWDYLTTRKRWARFCYRIRHWLFQWITAGIADRSLLITRVAADYGIPADSMI